MYWPNLENYKFILRGLVVPSGDTYLVPEGVVLYVKDVLIEGDLIIDGDIVVGG